jgi:4-diphosphocytidyl-2-C-methyl-D-erythritol kinase
MTASLQLRSYAKINWALDVLGRRDDGYHEVQTIYQTISLYDTIRIAGASSGIAISCDDHRVPRDDTNLAYKAAQMLRDEAGVTGGTVIQIQKRIPVAGGLGGGSSNAAAALMGLNRLWSTGLSNPDLHRIACELGSDVPFFLIGGTSLGVGRGEEVTPIEEFVVAHILLVNPGFPVSTADAYGGLSRLTRAKSAPIIPFALQAAKGVCGLPQELRNDLEEAVLPVHPQIAEIRGRLLRMGARLAMMSGSGATVFGVFDNSESLERTLAEMRASGYWAEGVGTISRREYQDTIFE